MRNKFLRFMYGRSGPDEYSVFLLKSAVIFCVLSVILNVFSLRTLSSICYWVSFVFLVYSFMRMFSKNTAKRYDENQKFLLKKMNLTRKYKAEKDLMQQRKYYHIYRCPSCRQRIRIPKGKGRIEVRCPKCSTTFIKKS